METVIYWDSSAVLAALGKESRSESARSQLAKPGVHLMSSLTFAETLSVLYRMRSGREISAATLEDAAELINHLPWRRFTLSPSWEEIAAASSTHGLRGADLWHLSLALTLRKRQFPWIRLLTYDQKLFAAATDEHLTP